MEDPATGLHRPRDYIRSLETQAVYLEGRVAYLENVLKETRPEVATDHLGNEFPPPDFETSPISPQTNRGRPEAGNAWTGNRQPPADAPGADTLSDEVALLCLGAAGREPQYFGPSSALSFSRIASSVMGLPRHNRATSSQPSHSNGQSGTRKQTRTDSESETRLLKAFPSIEKMALLSQAYFENIHPQYPFLHRPTVQNMEQECRDVHMRGELAQLDEGNLFFLLMVSARFWSDRRMLSIS